MRIDIPPRLVDIYEEIEEKDFEEHIEKCQRLSYKRGKLFVH